MVPAPAPAPAPALWRRLLRIIMLPSAPTEPAPKPPIPAAVAAAAQSSVVDCTPPLPHSSRRESGEGGSSPFSRRQLRASTTFWASPNRFGRCLSLQVIGARELPPATELKLELKAGSRPRHTIPLLLSEDDMRKGGSGRLDGGRMSGRVDFTLDGQLAEVEVHLTVTVLGPWWQFKKTEHMIARCLMHDERWVNPSLSGSSAPQWFPLVPCDADGQETETPAAAEDSHSPGSRSGPALLLRVQSFDAEHLESPASRERLFYFYSANGEYLTVKECDRMLVDVASGWRPDKRDVEEDGGGKSGCRLCVAHVLAAFGLYSPEEPLLSHLMYYHTLLWVCCRPPGQEHIPVVHRLYFVVLSVTFNLLVVILFMATDASLVTLHCHSKTATESAHECSELEVSAWRAAEVGVVALVDTAFWPLLKRLFLCIEDRLANYDESEAQHTQALWRRLAVLVCTPIGLCVMWVLLSAGGSHAQQLSVVLHEFASTWPTTRLTEMFKLMSMWGLLTEYGLRAPRAPDETFEVMRRRSVTLGEVHFREGISRSVSRTEYSQQQDPKKVPLLMAGAPC